MKKTILILCTIFLFCVGAQAQDSPEGAAMMKAWQAFMTPGDQHKMLAKDDGQWTEEITLWMAPGAPPTKSNALAVNKMILGGRYQQTMHTGEVMGMPFEGLSTVGYDNAKKVFVSSWVDNMGTGIMFMEGPWDEATKTISLKGKATDPMSGKDVDVRQTLKLIDNNTQLLEMYTTENGKEFKSMEIKLKRNRH